MSRKGGRGLTNIKHSAYALIQGLDYIKKGKERLIRATRNNTGTIKINRTTKTRGKWGEK